MNNLSIFLVLILILISLFKNNIDRFSNMRHHHHHQQKKEKNICRGFLSDLDYLNHMIPHHQVAVDISLMLQKITNSPIMQEILRKLIFNQKMEIWMMNNLKNKLPKNVTANKNRVRTYQSTISDFIKPNKLGLTKTYCDPHFFDPKEHMKHIKNMKLDDKMYIEHMIPHHQVAVDMSKVLLKNTSNDFMIYLAYRIIRSQQSEIIILKDLLEKSKVTNSSNLLR
tara:strand:- start:61 stop:735 length:675 start_codon:yes stop_codon:yes gene_type:complete